MTTFPPPGTGPARSGGRWSWRGARLRTAATAALIAAVLGVVGGVVVRDQVRDAQEEATLTLARTQVDTITRLVATGTYLGGDYGALPYELVGTGGRVVSSSEVLKPFETGGRAALPDPGPGGPQPFYRTWSHTFPERSGGGPLAGRTVVAVDGTIALPPGIPAATSRPDVERLRVYVFATSEATDRVVAQIDRILVVAVIALVVVVGLAAGLAVARSMRRVETILGRSGSGVVVPRTGDESEHLARRLDDLLAAVDEADRQQRRFVADAAHELRSPLGVLRTELDVATAREGEGPVVAIDRGRSARALARLEGLVDDLLYLARSDGGRPLHARRLDLVSLVGSAVEDHRPDDPTSCEVDLVAPAGAVVVDADPEALRRAVDNLLRNARRHATSAVEVRVHVEGATALVEVTDDGPGIAPADRERVFERFVRLDDARAREHGGSGLGLAICRDVARAHGGDAVVIDPVWSTGDRRGGRAGVTLRLALPGPPPSG